MKSNEVYPRTREDWRKWLKTNHAKLDGVWLVYYKKHTGKPTLSYDEAVEEALCYGWIDSIKRTVDDEKYIQKFTPRKETSSWSDLNKKRVARLVRQRLMTRAGMALVEAAKKNGKWNEKTVPARNFSMPDELKSALSRNKKAREFFDGLTAAQRKQFVGWIASAKREDTRLRRAQEAVKLLAKNQKLGLK